MIETNQDSRKIAYSSLDKDDLEEALIFEMDNKKPPQESLENIKYLLTSSDLKIHPSIHAYEDTLLRKACRNNRLDIVDFILTSPELKEHSNIHSRDDYCIKTACRHGYLELLQFLVDSPKLKEKIDIHTDDDDIAFRSAFSSEQVDILRYIIFDLKLEETSKIKEYYQSYLKHENHPEYNSKYQFAIKVKQMFELKELNNNLNNELLEQNTKFKKNKI